jgi:hypothetical protein
LQPVFERSWSEVFRHQSAPGVEEQVEVIDISQAEVEDHERA